LNVIENNNAGDVMPVAGALMHEERPANHAGVTRSGWLMLVLQEHRFEKLLCGRFRSGFFAIALVEAIDASGGIDQLLFAGEERMASRTNFDVQIAFLGGASLECLAASAANVNFDVFRVNSWFHLILRHSL
jgi:hypothetical protein